ncbi:hypothetical protein [Acinetobacter lwoffii]|uniref:phage tail fiber protein n=1 Tax=Acinetobacter lwoffii TaxID=28090 RepID=UPI003BF7647D
MARQSFKPGIAPSGVGGDTNRSANTKWEANFTELYKAMGAVLSGANSGAEGAVLPASGLPIANGGTGATTAVAARNNLGLGTVLKSDAVSVLTKPLSGGGAFSPYVGYSANVAYTSYAESGGASSKVGTLALKFNVTPSSAIPVLVIRGFSTGFGLWRVTLIFYKSSGTSSSMHQAFLEGSIPGKQLRVAYDKSGIMTILLGTPTTTWNYTTAILEDAFNFYSGDNVNNSYLNSASFMYYSEEAELSAGFSTSVTVPFVEFRTTKNTTVDTNGFIKAASPIIKLYADHIELNDEAEQQDITFEKLGIGDYLIKGSSGLAQSGWYVEQPKDANGNVFHAVVYDTLENGDISVKTYDQKMDGVKIVADLEKPVDVKENRFISIRLHELPQNPVNDENEQEPEPTITDYQGNPAPSRLHELQNGLWVISSENAAILENERLSSMPALTRRQFRLALVLNGYNLADIETLINSIEDPMQRQITMIEWQDATTFHRTNPSLIVMAGLMGLGAETVDQLWLQASTL